MFKVVVAGSRQFLDYNLMCQKLDNILKDKINEGLKIEIVSGTANGADKLGEKYAKDKNYNIKYFPADWDLHGKSAGYIRNKQMADYADAAVIFWDGQSKGSKHMIDISLAVGIPTRIVYF